MDLIRIIKAIKRKYKQKQENDKRGSDIFAMVVDNIMVLVEFHKRNRKGHTLRKM